MLISQAWLTRILRTANPSWSVSAEDFDAGFVRVGFETEGYEAIPETTGPLVLGRVEHIEELEGFKKPIRYCGVNVGQANGTGELQQIVCGARNFAEGDYVVVSLPGAVLPGDFRISARKTYGKVSEGMICSAMEVGLAKVQNPGIMTFGAEDLEEAGVGVGDDARGLLGLEDTVFDVNVTPDRGYALSARGLARELAHSFELQFRDPSTDPAAAALPDALIAGLPSADAGEVHDLSVAEEAKCAIFGLRKVEGIDPTAQSPFWLQRELMLCGQRPINAATDVTNYVMFLLGQPMHAFDADKITGPLRVHRAEGGEKLVTLDGVERTLDAEDVVISDDSGIQSLAGVMGGSTSEVSEETTTVLFEAAHWDQITVARTCRRHKLSSEASRRFERGTDPALVAEALDLAVALLSRIAGGRVVAGSTVVGLVPPMPTITMHTSRPGKTAGMVYPDGTTIGRLREIGCIVRETGRRDANGAREIQVTPPSWRPDLNTPADCVEEVLRLQGLENIPSIVPTAPAGRGLSPRQRMRRSVGHALAWAGYAEILPSPFIANDVFDVWGLDPEDPRRSAVRVLNPLENDYATIGTTLLPSMIDSLRRNVARGQRDVALYGVEQVCLPDAAKRAEERISPMLDVTRRPELEELSGLLASLPAQPLHVAVITSGSRQLQGTWGPAIPFAAADAIEAARTVGRAAGVTLQFRNADDYLPWHPGRCAEVLAPVPTSGDTEEWVTVGHAGELHPQVCERADIPARTCAVEMDLSALHIEESFPRPLLSPFPAVLQDVAVVVDATTPAAAVTEALRGGAGPLLEDIRLFDVYTAESLGEGKRSLTFSLRFRALDRTLTEEEASAAREAAVAAAESEVGATLRAVS
ncbi:phenylalanine--tRNA ligase subunit beta [Corynebacterium heidelbergense]|uniref:Phenylalanine--tRNA ligase beta subunit n=1 Tax=Corynebacterium heidelbergense TaxID=2055947 RepID=A0A364VBK2_9CORY|nr:phenylalanine--tRNA ligase subunit beta [Corynebacterium heidelbergense]RAV34032.1 phenylalanine--tRNA ligase subunit beta [Corynebacterium heidelbergense]WCZ36450.1 Phenylalanine--tRNA ligase beta subunit [Corynebacterium heidelbergense]